MPVSLARRRTARRHGERERQIEQRGQQRRETRAEPTHADKLTASPSRGPDGAAPRASTPSATPLPPPPSRTPTAVAAAMVGAVRQRTPLLMQGMQGLQGSIAQCLEPTSPVGSPGSCCPNTASGASAVAIDNKIEQAMDLVKSHLMFAVREEVEVLKDKIAELMDRINQLEIENSILKANATQETLEQLLLAPKPSPDGSPTGAQDGVGAAASPQPSTP